MTTCSRCGKSGFGMLEVKGGACPSCRRAAERAEAATAHQRQAAEDEEARRLRERAGGLLLTTETWIGDVDRLGIVATEVALGMNLFRDVLANVRDIFGGRSGAVQTTLEEARAAAFEDLRVKAAQLGADAVIAVDVDYHSLSTVSSVNMLLVAVSGTAVRAGRQASASPFSPPLD